MTTHSSAGSRTTHITQQGEHVTGIARDHGFFDPGPIWDDPSNAELAGRRQDGHILFPGDIIVIKEAESKTADGMTNARHRFKAAGSALRLHLRFHFHDGTPMAGFRYDAVLDGTTYYPRDDFSKSDGSVYFSLQPKSADARIQFRGHGIPFNRGLRLLIGHLDPIDTETGQRARLNNLGYHAGDPAALGGTIPEQEAREFELRAALEEFQCDQGLRVDGIATAETLESLIRLHGS